MFSYSSFSNTGICSKLISEHVKFTQITGKSPLCLNFINPLKEKSISQQCAPKVWQIENDHFLYHMKLYKTGAQSHMHTTSHTQTVKRSLAFPHLEIESTSIWKLKNWRQHGTNPLWVVGESAVRRKTLWQHLLKQSINWLENVFSSPLTGNSSSDNIQNRWLRCCQGTVGPHENWKLFAAWHCFLGGVVAQWWLWWCYPEARLHK